jgi:hypothetical protein
MIRILFGIFAVLHGIVHLLYFGQSARFFELQPGLVWPDGAWTFSKFLGNEPIRMLANILLVLAALLFVTSGVAIFARLDWWRLVTIAAAAFSTAVYLLLWNGKFAQLADNGWVGILINLVILAAILLFKWLKF